MPQFYKGEIIIEPNLSLEPKDSKVELPLIFKKLFKYFDYSVKTPKVDRSRFL